MTPNATATPLLRRAMQADAMVSGGSGLLLGLLPGPLSALIGFSRPEYLVSVGLGLIAYAIWLIFSARRPDVNLWAGRAAVVLNGLWVVGSILLLLGAPGLFNTLGQWLVGIVAAIVADFAIIQYLGLRRAARAPVPAQDSQKTMPTAAPRLRGKTARRLAGWGASPPHLCPRRRQWHRTSVAWPRRDRRSRCRRYRSAHRQRRLGR